MAANSNEYQHIAEDQTFQNRVRLYMHAAAHAVYVEPGGTNGHAQRIILANNILDGAENVRLWAYSCMTNATLQTAGNVSDVTGLHGISDTDLSYVVQTEIYNAFAGVE